MKKIKDIQDRYLSKELSVREFVEATYLKIKENDINSFITLDEENALKKADELDEKIKNKEKLGKLFGVTFGIKDNISVEGLKMTCGSKMLEDFIPVYDGQVIKRIKDEDGIIIGKTNLDEFAMGASSETSYFGPTKNPLDHEYISGGSSSGSAASVGGDEVMFALGSDTGGSSRQPAAFCGVLGYYPSYGRISRHGLASMANTFDQVGLIGRNVSDIVLVNNILSGHDMKDPNSQDSVEKIELSDYSFEGKKIALLNSKGQGDIEDGFENALNQLKEMGAQVDSIDLKSYEYIDSIYSVLMNVEVSSNMGRFDGLRYGYHTDNYETSEELYKKSRNEGLGAEVKRRIILGYALASKKDNQKIYKDALKGRKLLKKEMEEIFQEYDLIVSPTSTQKPWKIGERAKDPMAVYDTGTNNVIANLCGIPAISMPFTKGINKSLQFMAKRNNDGELLNAAYAFERSNDQ